MPQQYGDLVRFSVPRQEAFLVNRPEYIKNILQDNHRNYTKRTIQYDALAQITGRGLLTADGECWFRNRRLEQPAFAHSRLVDNIYRKQGSHFGVCNDFG